MIVNSAAGLVTADFSSMNGTTFRIIGKLNGDGTFTAMISGSDGSQWSQRFAIPAGATASTSTRRVQTRACRIAAGIAAVAGGIAGLAGLLAWGSTMTVVLAPAGAIAGGVAAVSGAIAGVAGVVAFVVCTS